MHQSQPWVGSRCLGRVFQWMLLLATILPSLGYTKMMNEQDRGDDPRLKTLARRFRHLYNDGNFREEDMPDLLALMRKMHQGPHVPLIQELGVVDRDQWAANYSECTDLITRAKDQGFYVEAISLYAQLIEFNLRMFIVSQHRELKRYDPSTQATLGNLITDAEICGMPAEVIMELRSFVALRNDALHSFILGNFAYSDLGSKYQTFDRLLNKVVSRVLMTGMFDDTFWDDEDDEETGLSL